MLRFVVCPALLILWLAMTSRAAENVSFQHEILPLLSDHCFACHGPDAGNRQADLRLDEEDAAKASAIIPGDAENSELYRRIASNDADLKMPPPDSAHALTPEDIGKIRQWIDSGAKWETHWAFTAPVKVDVPQVPPGMTAHNEIDAFVLSRMQQDGISPSKPATREQLIRRVSFDLTGLPPTLAEMDDFLNDTSTQAYERVVDRLLASPAFGERMTAEWLDVARYSDSYGLQVDRDRFVWPWRDWVIKAFNENMPYDQFLTQQIAGDLLPNATDDQILATTFCRLHPQEAEGGSVPEEFRVEYVADRSQTVGTAFLGLTFECCRCHDHKYDPLSQKEYYQFTSFFDNVDEAGLYSFFTESIPTPTLMLANEKRKQQFAELKTACEEAERKVKECFSTSDDAFAKWALTKDAKPSDPLTGQIASLDFEAQPAEGTTLVPGRVGQAVKLSGDKGYPVNVGNFQRHEPFSISLWMQTPDVKDRAVVFHRSRAWTDAGSRGYELLIEDGKLSFSLIHFWPGNAISIQTKGLLSVKEWHHVTVTYDGSSKATGLAIWVDGKLEPVDIVRDNLTKNITGGGGDTITIGERFRDRGFTDGLVDEFRVFTRELTPLEIAQLCDGKSLTNAIGNATTSEGMKAYYLATSDAAYQQSLASLQAAREAYYKVQDSTQEIMVMRELEKPRPTFLLARGAYDAKTEEVPTTTPASLIPYSDSLPRNRLGLAQWMTSPAHPLTSRVAVNRLWQSIFGNGLVRTPEDFGRQGQHPTHPELLDWLSRDFVEHGWDMKRLIKQMVMSSTYQQSTEASDETLAKDPQNLLLSRASSHRLSAEMLRDNALAVSGLLVRDLGGPPAQPYEVEASFKPVKRSTGPGLYRRSLYTYWKRTDPAPVMMTLDASKRDVCQMRRERTATPLEAFVLMNGPQFVEAARVLSQKVLTENTETDHALTRLFRTLTSRYPTDKELAILKQLYNDQLSYFREDSARTTQYLDYGDAKHPESIDAAQLAALTSVANALFSFDEVVNRR